MRASLNPDSTPPPKIFMVSANLRSPAGCMAHACNPCFRSWKHEGQAALLRKGSDSLSNSEAPPLPHTQPEGKCLHAVDLLDVNYPSRETPGDLPRELFTARSGTSCSPRVHQPCLGLGSASAGLVFPSAHPQRTAAS